MTPNTNNGGTAVEGAELNATIDALQLRVDALEARLDRMEAREKAMGEVVVEATGKEPT